MRICSYVNLESGKKIIENKFTSLLGQFLVYLPLVCSLVGLQNGLVITLCETRTARSWKQFDVTLNWKEKKNYWRL
jgi:hypothetical protein